jgi:hypothetical protein
VGLVAIEGSITLGSGKNAPPVAEGTFDLVLRSHAIPLETQETIGSNARPNLVAVARDLGVVEEHGGRELCQVAYAREL